jgi:hypothetical protein
VHPFGACGYVFIALSLWQTKKVALFATQPKIWDGLLKIREQILQRQNRRLEALFIIFSPNIMLPTQTKILEN